MRVELQNEEHCRYLRVYHYYRNLILSGQMKSETKLPSIRKGASELQMSRTTMENAYMLLLYCVQTAEWILCDGYCREAGRGQKDCKPACKEAGESGCL